MIDGFVKNKTLEVLQPWQDRLNQAGLGTKKLLVLSFLFGGFSCFCVALQSYIPALLFIILNRIFDSLAMTIKEGNDGFDNDNYLKKTFDVIFFGCFVFFFTLGASNTSLAAAFLLMGFLFSIAFRPKQNTPDNKKDIVENAEIIIFMIVSCMTPHAFAAIAALFGLVCLADAVKKTYEALSV